VAGTHRPHARASIVAAAPGVIEDGMTPASRQPACERPHHVVLDDHRRLPGRFFGRFTTSIAAELRRAGSLRAI